MKRLLINILPIKSVLGPPPLFFVPGHKKWNFIHRNPVPGLLVSQKTVRSHER